MYGSVDVDDRHDAADASKALADVVRLAVLGPATHVARAVGHGDAGRQLRVGAVLRSGHRRRNSARCFAASPRSLARLVHLECFRAG